MVEVLMSCDAKVRVGPNGEVRINLHAADSLENKKWSDGIPQAKVEIVADRDTAKRFDVGEQYRVTIDPIE